MKRAHVEVVTEENGLTVVQSVFSPPLACGFRDVEVPRTHLDVVVAQRRLLARATDLVMAQRLIRVAFMAAAPFRDGAVRLFLSDSGIATERAHLADTEVTDLVRFVEAVARAIHGEIARQPRPPWKQAVLDAWDPLVAELGADFDRSELRLRVKRGSLEACVFVLLEQANLITRIEIPLFAREVRAPPEVDVHDRLAQVGATATVASGKLEVTRIGLVANGTHLTLLVDVALGVATDLVKNAGPYR